MVSVIVPVYNVERYLPRCLDSIAAQTYRDIEVIMVDDGSTDSSGRICDGYCLKDTRFRVIHQENKWLAEARNTGLRAAEGEYVFFVDSDDYLHPRAIESLLMAMNESGCEVVIGRYMEVPDGDAPMEFGEAPGKGYRICRVEDLIRYIVRSSAEDMVYGVAWNKLIPKRLIEDASFPSYYGSEDFPFNVRYYLKTGGVAFVQDELYYYTLRPTSIMRSSNRDKSGYFNVCALFLAESILPEDEAGLRAAFLIRIYRKLLTTRFYMRGTDYGKRMEALSGKILDETLEEYRRSKKIPFVEKLMFQILYSCPWLAHAGMRIIGN